MQWSNSHEERSADGLLVVLSALVVHRVHDIPGGSQEASGEAGAAAQHTHSMPMPGCSTNTPAAEIAHPLRCKIDQPVNPFHLLGKRVSVKGDGADAWFDGVVKAYSDQDCKHWVGVAAAQLARCTVLMLVGSRGVPTAPPAPCGLFPPTLQSCHRRPTHAPPPAPTHTQVEWDDTAQGTTQVRIGLEWPAKLDLPEGEEPVRASMGDLEKLLAVLQAEEIGAANKINDTKDRDKLRILHSRGECEGCMCRPAACCAVLGLC